MTTGIVDTHIALWFIAGSERLPAAAKELLCAQGGRWFVSIVSVWEVMLKHQSRPQQMLINAQTFLSDCLASGFELLDLKPEHIYAASVLPTEGVHKDPFDRMLLAQARSEGMMLVTHDHSFEAYGQEGLLLV